MSQKKINTPTGKVKTKVVMEARRKAREEQDRNRRVNRMMRVCKLRGISEEDTKKYVEKLVEQLNAPKKYAIHVLFDVGQKDKTSLAKMAKQAILNSKIPYKILTDAWAFIEGDQEVLAKLREILPIMAKIYPYAMKPEAILPQSEHTPKKPTNNSKEKAAEAKAHRKALNKNRGHNVKSEAKCRVEEFIRNFRAANAARKAALKTSHKAVHTASGTSVRLKGKKRSKSVKMAPTAIKEAA